MTDILPADVPVLGRDAELFFYDGSSRAVIVTDVETHFAPGEIVVSRSDTIGTITLCNEGLSRLSGYSREELLGEPHHLLRHPDMPRGVFKELWETIDQGYKWHGCIKNLRKDGGFYWVFCSVVPNIRDGAIHGYTSVGREVSRSRIESASAAYREMLSEEYSAGVF
jgi:aerotaxis receptor